MDDIRLHAFSGLTGEHLTRLVATEISWSDAISEEGSINATVNENNLDIADICRPYGTIIAAISGKRIIHAGYLIQVSRADETNHGLWSLKGGGGLTILRKRLVINHLLDSNWIDGNVVVDQDNPAGNWPLSIKGGSYSDLVSLLITETKKWGTLPIVEAPLDGGSAHVRNYNSYDLATVYDRISNIADLDDGPEIRLDPVLSDDWTISFIQKTAPEIVDNKWKWNANLPDSFVNLTQQDADGKDMCSQSYITGGRENDKLLVGRAVSNKLQEHGWPLLQIANTGHSTVSQLSTLLSYARADVACGDSEQMTYGLEVICSLSPHATSARA